jgi:glycosyltransferase involved in cell wall biosynthesis
MLLITLLSAIALLLTILNSLTIRVVKNKSAKASKKVSILIPMRNEAANVDGCLESVLNQRGLSDFEIIVLNDHSTDATAEKLIAYSQVKVITGADLPDGWLGKIWACHQLSQVATGEILVFLDADVRLTEDAVASTINEMKSWSFISPYPTQLSIGLPEKIFQPLLHWSWLASVPLYISQKFGIKSMAVANGQFFVVDKNAYERCGGHEKIKAEVLDDLALARLLLAAKYKGGVAEGSKVASCTMYPNFSQLIKGYEKSLWKAFGGITRNIFALLLLIATGVFSLVAAIAGSELAALSFIFIYLSRIISSIRSGESAATAIAHPVAVLILIYINIKSWIGKFRGNLTWRDRVIS